MSTIFWTTSSPRGKARVRISSHGNLFIELSLFSHDALGLVLDSVPSPLPSAFSPPKDQMFLKATVIQAGEQGFELFHRDDNL